MALGIQLWPWGSSCVFAHADVALPMQLCGPAQAGPSLRRRWLSQTRSHHLLENDTNSFYLYWKDLLGRGEQGREGRAGRRGRQLPAPGTSLPAPGLPDLVKGLVKPNLQPLEGARPQVVQNVALSQGIPKGNQPWGLCREVSPSPAGRPQAQPVLRLSPKPRPCRCPRNRAVTLNSS